MPLGLSDRFSILQQSPHDLEPDPTPAPAPSAAAGDGQVQRWIPSRYNIRAVTDDGRLVLWNSFKGSMSVFGAAQRPTVEGLLGKKGFSARPQGITQYLVERGFLIKEETNEYRRIQLGFGREQYRNDILQFILLASEDCNFRCTYCYEDFARGTMKPWVRDGIKKLVEKRQGTLRQISVNWFGGEPLYGFEAIEDLAPFFLEVADRNSISYTSAMTTNAYLMTPDVAEKLLAWEVRKFQITLDGLEEDHDRSRPGRHGEATFATILENLKALSRRPEDYTVIVRYNFDRQNSKNSSKFLDMIEREFNRDPRFKVRFRPVGQWGGPNDAQLDVCGADEKAEMERAMKREARKRGLTLSDEISSLTGLGSQVCYAARPYNFIVGATGKLMKCTLDLDKNDRNVVGQLSPEGELILDQDKFAMWTEPAFEGDTKCKKCVVLPACQGVYCPLVRIDRNETGCSPLRKSAKKELIEAAEASDRRKKVVLKNEAPGASAESSPSS
jgi:uncharacterized protein